MAQLNTSLSDMPWFGQPADPGASLARGVASGAQIAGVQHQRASLAQQKMEFDKLQELRQAQEERAAALFPLEQTLKSQELQLKGLALKDVLEGRQTEINNREQIDMARRHLAAAWRRGDPLAGREILLDLSRIDGMVKTPAFGQFQKEVEAQEKFVIDHMKAKADLQRATGTSSTFTPGFGVDINPITKEPMAYFRTGEGSAKLLEDQEGTNVTWEGPGGEKFSMTSGGKGKTATTKPSEKEMGEATSTAMVMQMGNNLMKGLKPSNVGVAGTVNRTIAKVAGQIPGVKVPEAASEAVDAHTRMLQFNSYMQKTLKPDSNMDKRQVEIILGSLPDPGMIESVDSANRAIQATLRNVAEQQRLGAMSRGRPIPTAYMKPSEIKAAVDAGTMTEEKAREILMNTPYSLND